MVETYERHETGVAYDDYDEEETKWVGNGTEELIKPRYKLVNVHSAGKSEWEQAEFTCSLEPISLKSIDISEKFDHEQDGYKYTNCLIISVNSDPTLSGHLISGKICFDNKCPTR